MVLSSNFALMRHISQSGPLGSSEFGVCFAVNRWEHISERLYHRGPPEIREFGVCFAVNSLEPISERLIACSESRSPIYP